MRPPKAIFFDLDDTLIRAYGRPVEAWTQFLTPLTELLSGHPVEVARDAILAYSRSFWADQSRHKEWRQKLPEARRHCVREGLARLGITEEAVIARIADGFTHAREAAIELFPGAIETLQALRQRGVRLALVTNGAAEPQRAKVRRFALENHFDHIQIEGEVGYGKPEDEAYQALLKALDVKPHEAWIVGDNLEWEVAAPQRHGIFAIWHDSEGQGLPPDAGCRPDRIIRSVPEILDGW